jgi:folate-binding protein YgfZ
MPSTAVLLEGRDALPVLHRISTNALADLAPGGARATLFCDFRGRLLHRAVVAMGQEGAVWLLRDDAPGEPLVAYVEHHVFREEVRLTDLSFAWSVRRQTAPPIGAPLRNARAPVAEPGGMPSLVELESGEVYAPSPRSEHAEPPEASEALERARIESGRPAHGREIHEDFNPFEVGLGGEVHLNKGCFTGQEALMRLVTYRSVRRRLVRIEGTGVTPLVPADLIADGRAAGRLTSAVAAPDGAATWIGLAVVRHEAIEGAGLSLAGSPVEVAHVFPQPRPAGLGR